MTIERNSKIQPFNTEGLSDKSLKIVLERPRHWEIKLFAQSLNDQISSYSLIRRELELSLEHKNDEYVSFDNCPQLMSSTGKEFQQIYQSLVKLANEKYKRGIWSTWHSW